MQSGLFLGELRLLCRLFLFNRQYDNGIPLKTSSLCWLAGKLFLRTTEYLRFEDRRKQFDAPDDEDLRFLEVSNGRGVPQDEVTAHMWSNLAAALSNEDAIKFRDIVTEQMTPARIAEAQAAARACVAREYKGC